MSMAERLRYRAFFSYSHADTGAAKRAHGRLEGFRIDRELVGRVTPAGPVPEALRPIFRDRQDFDAGASLGAATLAALDDSDALILLASPHAARSKYVNEEVRHFKARHPDRPLIPLIVAGTPGDPENECFPPALRFAVAPDGAVTESPVDVLAADLREQGDGFELAIAKVVARLIGLAPDDVYRRAERERRRQGRIRAAVAGVIVVLAIAGGVFFWQSHQQRATLAEIAALVDKYSLVSPAQAATAPGARESLTQAITAIAEGAATDPRYAKALELLRAGRATEAEPLLKAVAEDKAKHADKDAKDAAAAYRNLASIAAVSDPRQARRYYAEAARLDPSDMWGMLQNGWFRQQAGQLDAAQVAYVRVIAGAKPGPDDRALVWAKFGLGDIAQQRGHLDDALATYREAGAILDRLAKSDAGNTVWQRDLSVAYEDVGDVQKAQGNLTAALASYQADFAIIDRLAKSDAGNTRWQRDLSVAHDKIGDVQVAQGNLPAALASYRASLAIRDRLAKSDAGNTRWQRDLAISYGELGDVSLRQDDLAEALASYQAAFAIFDRLAKSDADNAGWQRDLSVTYDKVGDVQRAQGDLAEALTSYQAGLAIADRLAKSDAGHTDWQRDLAVSYIKLGEVFARQDNLAEALASYQAAFAIFDRLAKSDAGNAGWQRDLAMSYDRIGSVQVAQRNPPAALASYQANFAIIDRLAKSDAGNADLQRDLAMSYRKLGAVFERQGDLAEALASYQASLAILDRLAKSNADDAGRQRDLAALHAKIGDVQVAQADSEIGQQSYRSALAIMEHLAAVNPTSLTWRAVVVAVNYKLAVNGDHSADRFAYIAATLRKWKSERPLSARQADLLAEVEARLSKPSPP
jgi:tetratricopeptide (TPR) repeat protein